MASSKNADKIRDQLSNKRVTARGWTFIPQETFDTILTGEVISELILEYGYSEKTNFSHQDICNRVQAKGTKRVFAILLYINAGHLILNFVAMEWFSGHGLPFSENRLAEILINEEHREKRKSFYMDQWMFIAPTLIEGGYTEYNEETCMPFLEEKELSSQGQNSTVSEITVPLCHLETIKGKDTLRIATTASYGSFGKYGNIARVKIVRKRLRNDKRAVNELKIHRSLVHESVVPFYAAYFLRNSINILLPKFEKSLAEFLRQEHQPQLWLEQKTYFTAILGLSDAIQSVHNFRDNIDPKLSNRYGCHHDIKPDNILVDLRAGRLLLADFGLAEIHSPIDGSNNVSSAASTEYTSPEGIKLSFGRTDQHVGRKSDIWSFGCILADIVVYLENPSDRIISQFRQDREMMSKHTTFPMKIFYFHDLDEINPGVWNRLDKVQEESKCRAIRDLVDLIRDMLALDQSMRPETNKVTERLEKISHVLTNTEFGVVTTKVQMALPIISSPPLSHQQSLEMTPHATVSKSQPSSSQTSLPGHDSAKREYSLSGGVISRSGSYTSIFQRDWRFIPCELVIKSLGHHSLVKNLWRSPSIRNWASSELSEVLVIHSPRWHYDDLISLVAANILYSIYEHSGSREIKAISHFCEPDANINGLNLSRSLLVQLRHYTQPQSSRDKDVYELQDVIQMMGAFVESFRCLKPDTTIVCVIDHLRLCDYMPEQDDYMPEEDPWQTGAVIRCLTQLIYRESDMMRGRLKLIVQLCSMLPTSKAKKNYGIKDKDILNVFDLDMQQDIDGSELDDTFWKANPLDWK